MTVSIYGTLSVCLPIALPVFPFYKWRNWGITWLSCPRLWSRSGVKSRQSGSRTHCLNLYFVIDGCCSVHYCGVTLPKSPWAPMLPDRASQRSLISSFFTIWLFSMHAQRYVHTSWVKGCSPAAHLCGPDGWQALSLVTSLVRPSPRLSMRTPSSDTWKGSFRTLQLPMKTDSDSVCLE